MAKQRWIDGMEDEVPQEVQDAADDYDKAHRAHAKTKAKLNTAQEYVLQTMADHKVERVKIRNGDKVLVYSEDAKVKIEKPKSAPDAGAEE